jgi:hypothetical protein
MRGESQKGVNSSALGLISRPQRGNLRPIFYCQPGVLSNLFIKALNCLLPGTKIAEVMDRGNPDGKTVAPLEGRIVRSPRGFTYTLVNGRQAPNENIWNYELYDLYGTFLGHVLDTDIGEDGIFRLIQAGPEGENDL